MEGLEEQLALALLFLHRVEEGAPQTAAQLLETVRQAAVLLQLSQAVVVDTGGLVGRDIQVPLAQTFRVSAMTVFVAVLVAAAAIKHAQQAAPESTDFAAAEEEAAAEAQRGLKTRGMVAGPPRRLAPLIRAAAEAVREMAPLTARQAALATSS